MARGVVFTTLPFLQENGSNKLECLILANLFRLVECNTLAYWTHL
jgi:hypothetical protein